MHLSGSKGLYLAPVGVKHLHITFGFKIVVSGIGIFTTKLLNIGKEKQVTKCVEYCSTVI